MTSFETHAENETIDLGIDFAKRLAVGDVVAIYGDLGTGKTRFIKGICKGLGVKKNVTSPTFTIVNEYIASGLNVYHFDFYRVKYISEIREVGFEEYLSRNGVCLIEWAEKAQDLLPLHRFNIHLTFGKDKETRIIEIKELVEVSA